MSQERADYLKWGDTPLARHWIYIASPYTHQDPNVMTARYEAVSAFTMQTLKAGHMAISPVATTHPIAHLGQPKEGWYRYCLSLLLKCDELWILKLEGWCEFGDNNGMSKSHADIFQGSCYLYEGNRMISSKVPHTYLQHGVRYYAIFIPVTYTSETEEIYAHNFFVFDHGGRAWMTLYHTDKEKVLAELGGGILAERRYFEMERPEPAYREPDLSDEAMEGLASDPEKGFAVEVLREGLGLDLVYLWRQPSAEGRNTGATEGAEGGEDEN